LLVACHSHCCALDQEDASVLGERLTVCSNAAAAPFIAACIPSLHALRLALVGSGNVEAEGLVASISRSKDRRELLQGPLIYVVVLSIATVVSWRTHLPGLCAVAMMCGGDGMADLVGRRIGSARLPWNRGKSWAGSLAMLVGGFALMCGCAAHLYCLGAPQNAMLHALTIMHKSGLMLSGSAKPSDRQDEIQQLCRFILYFNAWGLMSMDLAALAPTLASVATVCTIVESFPATRLDDNWSVPLIAAAMSHAMGFTLRTVALTF
jgi:dolichol kinase